MCYRLKAEGTTTFDLTDALNYVMSRERQTHRQNKVIQSFVQNYILGNLVHPFPMNFWAEK